MFQELKELQYLLKIKNDYINELEAYKYNLDRDYLRLEKENQRINGKMDLQIIIEMKGEDLFNEKIKNNGMLWWNRCL